MRRGFTLIELMVSTALTATVCYTIFVAIRVAGQALTVSNRISLETRLMTTGVQAALEELDFWRYYDDPAGDQPLRLDKHPFFPQTFTAEDFNCDFAPVRDPSDSYENWWRRDSRTWLRMDTTTGIASIGDHALGDFTLFGKIDYADATALGGAEKRWHHRFVKEMSSHLGYYAMLDYGPPCMQYGYYLTTGVIPGEYAYTLTFGGTGSFVGWAWAEGRIRDFVAATSGTFYTITVPSRASNPLHQVNDINRGLFLTYVSGAGSPNPGWGINDAYPSTGGKLGLLPLVPQHWPEQEVIVRHYMCNARQFHAAAVTVKSPITGQAVKLTFTTLSTTLRGARMARGLDVP
jgi:prepilin-type N-terminal cleavage/methylation domain-containing protein